MPKSKNNRKGKRRSDRRQVGSSSAPSIQTPKPPRTCKHLDRAATLKIFTPDECADIITHALNNWTEVESKIQQDTDGRVEQNFVEDLDYRNTTLFVPPKPEDELFSKILGTIMECNETEDGYGFDIQGMAEPPNMMRYLAPDIHPKGKPGKYDWHMDVGPGPVPSMRKLSYSILLNAGEYEGGELAFHVGRNVDPHPGQTTPDACGNMVLFPSYLIHKVLPMTSGTRYVIVGWVHGDSFR